MPTYDVAANPGRLGIVTMEFRNTENGDKAVNVLTFYATLQAPTLANFSGLANNVGAWDAGLAPYTQAYAGLRHQDWVRELITARTIDGSLSAFNATPFPGTIVGQPLPQLLTMASVHRTGVGGRRRGMTFVPSPSVDEAEIGSGAPELTYRDEIEASFEDLRTTLLATSSVGWEHVVYRRTAQQAITIIESAPNLEWDVMRRRGKD